MEKNRLGRTNFHLSKIGIGTVQFGLDYGFTEKKTQDKVDEILSYANEKGVNFIDTARSYGDSEEKIGKFLEQNKNQFIIATKLELIKPEEVFNKDKLKSKIYRSIETSLKMLKQNHLDILQLHQTENYLINNKEFWRILTTLKESNEITSIGVSVYEEEETANLIEKYGEHIDFFQIPYNVFDRRFENLQNLFREHQMGTISRSTFLKGVVTCKNNELPAELEELKEYKTKLENTANELSVKVSELALNYACNKEFITTTILGIDTVQELEENINAVKNEKLVNKLLVLDDLKVSNQKLIDPRKWTSL